MTDVEQLAALKAIARVEAEILAISGKDFQIWGDMYGDYVSRATVLRAISIVKKDLIK